jgi:ribosomal protein S27E
MKRHYGALLVSAGHGKTVRAGRSRHADPFGPHFSLATDAWQWDTYALIQPVTFPQLFWFAFTEHTALLTADSAKGVFMSVACPSCQHKIVVKAPKPGRFKVKCAKCSHAFVLAVANDMSVSVASPVRAPDATVPGPVPAYNAAEAAMPAAPDAETAARPKVPAPHHDPASAYEAGDSNRNGAAPHDEDDEHAAAPCQPAAVDATAAAEADDDATRASADPTDREEPNDAPAAKPPLVLGNYEIIKRLGKGGMGAVYLARQRSLDRPVAIKVINPKWAKNPRFLVRFTREAFAAAQLVHHNVVQVYDIGENAGINWFSMEFVDGTSLGELLGKKGRLDPMTAVGYVLQAARGLQFAHERGMVHRDVKPDNLMLNKQGVVKVADLGLVRTPGAADEATDDDGKLPRAAAKGSVVGSLSSLAGVTLANQTMGTPAYMAPEQARDATHVDERADIYSLGCTLYVLVTGKPVFRGKAAQEVMQRHQKEAITRPEVHVSTIPMPLSDIIVKMLAKNPADRFQNTAEVVQTLEEFLGVAAGNQAAFTAQSAETLEHGVQAFNAAPAARRRPLVLAASMAICGIAILFSLGMGAWFTASCFLGLAVLTPLACFVVNGIYGQSYLFRKTREYLLGNRWFDWVKVVFVSILCLAILYFIGFLWAWLTVCVIAVGLAFAGHFLLDRPVTGQRQGALVEVEKMLKGLRLRGVSEAAIQEYVCKFAGNRWEEVFEELFGYDAKLAARAKWGAGPKGPRPKHAAWRDALVRWIDARQQARQEARARRYLQAVEQKNFVAEGMKPAEARRQAEAVAVAMVEMAAEMKHEADVVAHAVPVAVPEKTPEKQPEKAAAPAPKKAPEPPRRVRVDLRQLCDVAEKPAPIRRSFRPLFDKVGIFVGGGVRLLLAAGLLCVGLGWLHEARVTEGLANAPLSLGMWQQVWARAAALYLAVPFVPNMALSCLAIAVAGFLLLLTTFQAIRWLALLHYICVATMVFGPMLGVPEVGPLNPAMVSLAAGSAGSLLLIAFAWMRPRGAS